MKVLDLFSGIGGFSLGLERAGMKTVAFCECDPYCQQVLRKHWPDVPVFGDVRTLIASSMADAASEQDRRLFVSGIPTDIATSGIDVICGGFPCQDISVAGKGAGLAGKRSGLWREFARIIGEIRSRYVLVENVSALLSRGLGDVLGDLAALGYDAEWHCIPACAVGAPHRRDRVWIIAYADRQRLEGRLAAELRQCAGERAAGEGHIQNAAGEGRDGAGTIGPAEANGSGALRQSARSNWWQSEPDVGRVAHGVSARVDRLRALGNAIVPQIAEIIGRAIMSIETTTEPATF